LGIFLVRYIFNTHFTFCYAQKMHKSTLWKIQCTQEFRLFQLYLFLVPRSQTLTTTPKANSDWSDVSSIQEFPTNAFGQVDFITEDEGSLKPAK
jgi:hypothetical protein